MAIYQYTTADHSDTFDESYPIGTAPRFLRRNGRRYHLDITAAWRGSAAQKAQKAHGCSTWPMPSLAAAVHPDQVPEAMEHDRKHGIPTQYTDHGEPIFTGPQHRKRYCEVHGLYDRNGGYSDPQRRGAAAHDLPEIPRRHR